MHFVVTGATGWVGRAALAVLERHLGPRFGAQVCAFASKPGTTQLQSGTDVQYRALDTIGDLPPRPYAFLHCAFLGKERVAELPQAEYVQRNEAISQKVVDAARRLGAAGFFVPSSGAVYAKDRTLEKDAAANPYGVMKLADEARFTRLAQELRQPLVIARVFNVAGPYINKLGNYALGSILENIRQRQPVTLHAAQPVIRSYVHIEDLLEVALACLVCGDKGVTAFDTAGEREIEVGELAQLALEVMGWPEGRIARPPLDLAAPANRYVGDGTAFKALAQRHGIAFQPLPQQIRDTANFLAAS